MYPYILVSALNSYEMGRHKQSIIIIIKVHQEAQEHASVTYPLSLTTNSSAAWNCHFTSSLELPFRQLTYCRQAVVELLAQYPPPHIRSLLHFFSRLERPFLGTQVLRK